MDYDFIVVGAGPSGSSFARHIASKYKVLLVDKRNLDKDTDFYAPKACGGLLNLECQRELARQSISIPFGVINEPQMFTVKAIDFNSKLANHYQKSYLNIDREKFDRFLFNNISSHVEVMTSTFFSAYEKIQSGFKVKLKKDGDIIYKTSRRIIDASGASGVLRKLNSSFDVRSYACIQRRYYYPDRLPYMFSVFDNHITDYYGWGIQKGDELLIGVAIRDKMNAKSKFEFLINRLESIGFDLSNEVLREGAILIRPEKSADIDLGKSHINYIGEAASLISPSSSEGISFALRSGRFLAEAVNTSFVNYPMIYKKKCDSLKRAVFIKNKKAALMYNTNCRNIIMKSGVLSSKIVDTKNIF